MRIIIIIALLLFVTWLAEVVGPGILFAVWGFWNLYKKYLEEKKKTIDKTIQQWYNKDNKRERGK